MNRIRGSWSLLHLVFLVLVAAAVPSGVRADERILSFDSNISIDADAGMRVVETIRVRAEGRNIKRGIYRDFPTNYTDAYGNRFVVDFEVLDVSRDGQRETWRAEARSNGVRVYIGHAERFLDPGEYEYTIAYRTNRQIGFFDDHDELYWNVTGNGWIFPMDTVSARVQLPGTLAAEQMSVEGHTGVIGAAGQDYEASVEPGAALIRSTRVLNSTEGLTVVVSWPKGIVAEPGVLARIGYVLQDNRGVLLALVALLFSSTYLFVMWSRYGKDPEAGVVFAHYEPPEGYSPASARYVAKMSYDNKTLSAAVINLAVKGHLTISNDNDDYVLCRETSSQPLAPGESALLQKLFRAGSVIELDDKNHKIISRARSAHRRALRRDYLDVYFANNTRLLLPSLVITALLLGLTVLLRGATPAAVVLFVLSFAMHGLYGYLLKAPTVKGRRLMDNLEGFRLYLDVAEKDDLNLRHPPDLTPELFERYLPFAVALGVEQTWAEQFSRVFAALEAKQGMAYQPHWYRGDFNHARMGSFAGSVGSSFASAISSAASPPGSASGAGGGGSSGGGGGGGGGGGW